MMRRSVTTTLVCVLALLSTCSPAAQKNTEPQSRSMPRAPHSRTEDDGPLVYADAPAAAVSEPLNRGGFNSLNVTPTPCPDNANYCESSDDYPLDLIKDLLQKQPKTFQGHFYNEEEDLDTNKFAPDEEDLNPLCRIERKVINPTTAKGQDGSFEFVINAGNYKQGILVETCKHSGQCTIPGSLSLGYTSRCVQKKIVRTLVVLDTTSSQGGGFITKPFDFPSCCSCVITMEGSSNRFGGGLLAASTLPTTPALTTASKTKNTKS